jgi:hypothetical protein
MVNIIYKNKYMETLRKQSLFVLAALTIATTCRAQTAEEIVNKSIDAVGGKDAIAAVKSIVYNQSLEVMGNEVSTVTTIVAGKGFKSETDFQGTKIIRVMTDHGGWAVNPMAPGQATPTALPDDQVKQSAGSLNVVPLMGWSTNGGKLQLQGKDTADYKIHMTNTVGTDVVYYINQKTYLLDKSEITATVSGQSMTITMHYGDYRKTDPGLLVAYSWVQDLPQMSLTFTTKSIDINKPVDPTIFDMPKN